jgi:hypothetical protein
MNLKKKTNKNEKYRFMSLRFKMKNTTSLIIVLKLLFLNKRPKTIRENIDKNKKVKYTYKFQHTQTQNLILEID